MNKKIYAPLVLSLAAIIIAVWTGFKPSTQPSADQTDTFSRVLRENKITICYVPWPPSVIKDPNSGTLSGFLIDLMARIASDAGFETQYVESTWGGFSADVTTGKCDVGAAGFFPLINRSTAVAFTHPFYYAGNNGVIRPGDTRFNTILDLNRADVKVAVIQGEFAQIYAQQFLPNAQLVVLEQSSDNTAPLVAVSSGQADAGLIMDDVSRGYAQTHPEIKLLFNQPYSVSPIAWAVRLPDQQLLNFFNNALGYLEATGELDALAQKYNSTWFTSKRDYQRLAE